MNRKVEFSATLETDSGYMDVMVWNDQQVTIEVGEGANYQIVYVSESELKEFLEHLLEKDQAKKQIISVGTKSILFGAHQFLLHPIILAWAWWKLYGFPWDPRLWLAFFVHDLGYWGKPDMDGDEGEKHVEFGANLMGWLFGPEWRDLCLYHSRYYAKRDGKPFSRLCVADKLAIVLDPWWLYLPRVWISGELWEYMAAAGGKNDSKYKGEPNSKYVVQQLETGTIRGWHRGMTTYLAEWVEAHKNGGEDTWTPG